MSVLSVQEFLIICVHFLSVKIVLYCENVFPVLNIPVVLYCVSAFHIREHR